MVQRVPLVTDVITHARGDLVARLDEYQYRHGALFELVIQVIEREFVPIIKRHAIAGIAIVRTKNPVYSSDLAIEMALDVLSERGYHVVSDTRVSLVAHSFDRETGRVENVEHVEYEFQIRFRHPEIRESTDNTYNMQMQLRK